MTALVIHGSFLSSTNQIFVAVLSTFIKYLQTQFDKKIRIFQSDGGREFNAKSFKSYLLENGIHHQMSCRKTPEQNGLAERKHRNITELGLTMLFHEKVPKRFWVEAFGTAVWLINRLPTTVLNMKSPYELLLGKGQITPP